MNKNEKKGFLSVIFSTMGWPVFGGLLLCVGFYALIHLQVIRSQMVQRYFAGHPVEYAEAALFFVGAMALLLKGLNIVGQFGTLHEVEITQKPAGGQPVQEAAVMLERIGQFPAYVRHSYFVRRLESMFQFVDRKRSASGLEDELKHQSELDAVRQHDGYGLVRMIIWATPMLGFLGTVIGITMALGDLSPQALVSTPEKAMEGLLGGLGVAFDTTALALTLSIVLMFCQFLTNQLETELLEAVDARVDREMVGRFADEMLLHGRTPHPQATGDPDVNRMHELGECIMNSVAASVEKQAEIWQRSLGDSQQRWDDIMRVAGSNIEDSMTTAFRRSIREHSEELSRNEENSQLRMDRRWEQLQSVLTDNARVIQAQQTEMVKQGDLMLQAINATGEVTKLQHALNENMRSLSLVGTFDEAVMNLSAAITLLNARLGAPQQNVERVRLYQDGERRRPAA